MEINKIYHGDCLEVMRTFPDNCIDALCCDPPYGISFMGKKWDYDVPKVELWQEVLRVLKPGGHALVACGTRTQHRMAVNLEDAGFEIRDIVAWIYGSGFPKSLNIGKAVDKLQGNEREDLGISDATRPNHQKGNAGMQRLLNNNNPHSEIRLTKGSSPYEGWGTALKPAMELWTLCRKPLEEKTVAQNVLKYGTGGINIDGCRVEGTDEIPTFTRDLTNAHGNNFGAGTKIPTKSNGVTGQGRFPANLIHDGSDEVVEGFPENTQRFFYTAKASKSERNKGLEGFEEKEKYKLDNSGNSHEIHSKNNKRVNPKTGVLEERKPTDGKSKNSHPTVKPVALMRYLCRLITPKGGTILDPFVGSGTTGIGAKLEGFDFIGIEREEEYCKIAEARINALEPRLL